MNLMSKATEKAIFLHCLPAHRGEEIDDTIIDSSYSVVWQQAHNRLYSSMALIDFLLSSSKTREIQSNVISSDSRYILVWHLFLF